MTTFEEAYEASFDQADEAVSLFFIGYTYSMMDQGEKALDTLLEIDMEPTSDYYYDYYFTTGKLLLDTYAYNEAADFLVSFDDRYMNQLQKQTIAFLTGVAYNGTGERTKAKEYLQTAFTLDSDSDVGNAARHLYDRLQ